MRRQAGFTLLEMLVALVVFGLLMAALGQTLRYGLAAWQAERRDAAGPATLAVVDLSLRRLIEQAAPLPFNGAPDELTFTTTLPAGSALGGRLADVTLLAGPDDRLVLRWRQHLDGLPLTPPRPARQDVLLTGVKALHCSYLAAQPEGPPLWVSEIKGGGPPMLVRIRIEFTGGAQWPDLVAAPVAGGS